MSRRRFLAGVAAVGGTAAAGALLWKVATEDDGSSSSSRSSAEPKLNAAGAREPTTMHVDLSRFQQVADDAVIQVSGRQVVLVAHDDESRARLVAPTVLASIPPERLTHYAEQVDLPAEAAVHIQVLDRLSEQGYPTPETRFLASRFHVPSGPLAADRAQGAKVAAALAAYQQDEQVRTVVAQAVTGQASSADVAAALAASPAGASGVVGGQPGRFDLLGVPADQHPTTAADAQVLDTAIDPVFDTAVSLVLQHPELTNRDPAGAARLLTIAQSSPAVQTFAAEIAKILASMGEDPSDPGSDGTWDQTIAVMEPMADADGAPVTFSDTVLDKDGKPLPTEPLMLMRIRDRDGSDGKPKEYPALRTLRATATAEVIDISKADEALVQKTWNVYPADAPASIQPGSLGEPEVKLALDGECTQAHSWGLKVELDEEKTEASSRTYALKVGNDYLRHLMIAVQFIDANGNAIKVAGTDYGGMAWWHGAPHTDFLGFLDLVPSAPTMLGVTIPGANWSSVEMVFPEGAQHAELYALSLAYNTASGGEIEYLRDDKGQRLYGDVFTIPDQVIPIIFTALCDLAIPTFMMLNDAASAHLTAKDCELNKVAEIETGGIVGEFEQIVDRMTKMSGTAQVAALGLGVGAVELSISATDVGSSIGNFIKELVGELFHILMDFKVFEKLAEKLMVTLAGEEAVKTVPFFGEMIAALSILEDAVQLATTNVELAIAPPTQRFRLTPSYAATITVTKDPRDSGLPRTATWYQLVYSIRNSPSKSVFEGPVTDASSAASLTIEVPEVSVGGEISWTISLLTEQGGYVVGVGTTDWAENATVTDELTAVTIPLTEQLVPLGKGSTMVRQWTTDASSGTVTDRKGATIGGTQADLDPNDPGKVGAVGSATIATIQGVAGYTWSSGGRWFGRNVGTREPIAAQWASMGPFDRQPLLAYDTLSSSIDVARNFLVDPRPAPGGAYLRGIDVTKAGTVAIDRTKAYGQFPADVFTVAYNPVGAVVGLMAGGRLAVCHVTRDPRPNVLAPVARVHSGALPAGASEGREGFMSAPALVACRADGVILVLDARKPSVHAFNLMGNPIRIFGTKASEVVLEGLAGGAFHGFSVDGGNYLYVVSSPANPSGLTPDDYVLSVFNADGVPVFSTKGVNAAQLTVDLWRNGYSVDYLPLAGPGGKPAAELGAVEPSLSVWTPKT